MVSAGTESMPRWISATVGTAASGATTALASSAERCT
ncbi:Uncharacterised protein [Mycobacteroides abscessus subsp. abscessus]|nr:Uncharacterised protein [Mycobacteroides abscessus subsp. abscessus]